MDAAGETTVGLKGNAWEERVDWGLQVLRTVCLACELASLRLRAAEASMIARLHIAEEAMGECELVVRWQVRYQQV